MVLPAGQHPSQAAPDESAAEVMAHPLCRPRSRTLDAARAAADRLINTYRRENLAAVASFDDDLDALLTIDRFPGLHHIR